MKITKVEAIPVRQKGEIKKINDSAQDGIIIKVYTDEGIIGYGEVDSAPWVVKSIIDSPVSHRICQGLGQAIIGLSLIHILKTAALKITVALKIPEVWGLYYST